MINVEDHAAHCRMARETIIRIIIIIIIIIIVIITALIVCNSAQDTMVRTQIDCIFTSIVFNLAPRPSYTATATLAEQGQAVHGDHAPGGASHRHHHRQRGEGEEEDEDCDQQIADFAGTVSPATTCATHDTAGDHGVQACIAGCSNKSTYLGWASRKGVCEVLCALATSPCREE